MDITRLTLDEVGERIEEYLPPFIQDKFSFQESYLLDFEEIKHAIPTEYHQFFKDDNRIHSASGFVEDDSLEYDYTVILLSMADYSQALFLLLQKEHKITNEIETEFLKSFLSDTDRFYITIQLKYYKMNLTEIVDYMEANRKNLHDDGIGKIIKRKLLDLIQQTITILEEFY